MVQLNIYRKIDELADALAIYRRAHLIAHSMLNTAKHVLALWESSDFPDISPT